MHPPSPPSGPPPPPPQPPQPPPQSLPHPHQQIPPPQQQQQTPSPALFQCTECQRTYTRVDHLARHVRSHLQERPFKCPTCGKGFGRPDLLKRHIACHEEDGNGAKRQKRQVHHSNRVSQACKACATAKLKCEDSKPCARCRQRGIACEKPDGFAHARYLSSYAPSASQSESSGPHTPRSGIGTPPTVPPSMDAAEQHPPPPSQPLPPQSLPPQPIPQQPLPPQHLPTQPLPSQPSLPAGSSISQPQPYHAPWASRPEPYAAPPPYFTSSAAPSSFPQPQPQPTSIAYHPADFSDFLRDVIAPITPESFANFSAAPHWTTSSTAAITAAADAPESRNILDFTVSDPAMLEFSEADLSILDQLGSSVDPFNNGPPQPPFHLPSIDQIAREPAPLPPSVSATPTPSSSTPRTPHLPAPLVNATAAYARSTLSHWSPVPHESRHLEVQNLSLPQLTSPLRSARSSNAFATPIPVDPLTPSTRDRILAMILNTHPDRRATIALAFPAAETLDACVRRFFVAHALSASPYIHAPTIELNRQIPEVVGAILAAGAVHSSIRALQKLGLAVQEVVRVSLKQACEERMLLTREVQTAQALALELGVGLWSGVKRKRELSESAGNPLITMLRRGQRFARPLPSQPSPSPPTSTDDPQTLTEKWRAWAEMESFRRTAWHAFLHDSRQSMALLTNPLVSYAELRLPLPGPRSLWDAPTAEAWRDAWLALPASSTGPEPPDVTLAALLHRPERAYPLLRPHRHDIPFALLIALHALWGPIWEYISLASSAGMAPYADAVSSNDLDDDDLTSQLTLLRARHTQLLHLHARHRAALTALLPSLPPPRGPDRAKPLALLELLGLHLHAPMPRILCFAGAGPVEEARACVAGLLRWWEGGCSEAEAQSEAPRHALRGAARVLRVLGDGALGSELRGFWAAGLFWAGVVGWVGAVLGRLDGGRGCGGGRAIGGRGRRVCIDADPDTEDMAAVDEWLRTGVGEPGIHCYRDGAFVSLAADPAAWMRGVGDEFRALWRGLGERERLGSGLGSGLGEPGEDAAAPPPFVEGLVGLCGELGRAGGLVGVAGGATGGGGER